MFKNVLFILSLFVLIGCDSNEITTTEPIIPPPQNEDKLIINQDNSDIVIASIISSLGILRDRIEKIPRIDIDKVSKFGSIQTSSILDISDITNICKDGGKAILNSASSKSVDITFKECEDGDTIINGNSTLNLNDSVYHLILDQFSYNDDSFFKRADITYDERWGRKDIDAFISSGFIINDGEQISLEDVSFQKISDNYILNGDLGTGCLGGVIIVKTIQAISSPDNECPDDGELYAVGGDGSTLGITIKRNMSIETFLNNEIREYYNSCVDLPTYSDVCNY
ncbi:MAG: hypothetical protein JJV88_03880 [Sulfurovum sp.]|nr:hypothetical protein [Sulfurovaceae bacterium]